MAGKIFRAQYGIIVLHILAWLFVFWLPELFNSPSRPGGGRELLYLFNILKVLEIILFYLNAFWLAPMFLNKKTWPLYAAIFLFIIALITTGAFIISQIFSPQYALFFERFIRATIFMTSFILITSISYKIINDNIHREKQRKEKENENLKTELSFLRSQVSPHFMFNILNSIVSLARKKSELLEPALIKLSSLMHYMIYESGEAEVSVEKEIEYLQSYIDLQKLRFPDGVKVVLNIDKGPVEGYIEPMLLIPFVENAFKHGIGMIEEPEINIWLNMADNKLVFMVQNKFNNEGAEEKDKNSGIGLSNLKRRLNLLYPDTHTLVIEKENNWFVASLNLQLQ